jgi:hypothetical protein
MSKPVMHGREIGQQGGRFEMRHTFPRVLGCKRGSGIKEGDITEVRVYLVQIDTSIPWYVGVTQLLLLIRHKYVF